MSLALHYRMFITAQGCRIRNDLYCVEWDVKLYYTIPFFQCFSVDLTFADRARVIANVYCVCSTLGSLLDVFVCRGANPTAQYTHPLPSPIPSLSFPFSLPSLPLPPLRSRPP